jgi:hypothetical protein
MIKHILTFLVLFVLLVGAYPTPAMETDQYNLPPVPLADIAPEVEVFVAENIQTAIAALNAEITRHDNCLNPPHSAAFGTRPPSTATVEKTERNMSCSSLDKEASTLDELRKPDAVAKAVYERLGSGSVLVTPTGKWLNSHNFEHQPAQYKAPFLESIYWIRPANYTTLSPTICMYGVEFGTDKLDHMFQQGYTYYRKYNAALKAGKSDADALHAAVAWGRSTENLFYGYVVSGVYSNADLAANLAGLRFYQSLTNDVQLGAITRPALLKVVDGKWRMTETNARTGTQAPAVPIPSPIPPRIIINPESEAVISPDYHDPITIDRLEDMSAMMVQALRAFITPHLNEAYNPSNYLPLLYPLIKSAVKKHACSEWHAAFPALTADELTARSAALTTWNGLDYGYKRTSRQVRLADTCFADKGVLPSH